MPLLDQHAVEWMMSLPPEQCRVCKADVRRNYCRQCDEFFMEGHAAGCSEISHEGHRKYNLETGEADPPVYGNPTNTPRTP